MNVIPLCSQGAHNLVKGQIHKSLSYNVNYLSRRFHLYVESKKKLYKGIYLQNRNRLTDIENKLMVTKRKGKRDKLWTWD